MQLPAEREAEPVEERGLSLGAARRRWGLSIPAAPWESQWPGQPSSLLTRQLEPTAMTTSHMTSCPGTGDSLFFVSLAFASLAQGLQWRKTHYFLRQGPDDALIFSMHTHFPKLSHILLLTLSTTVRLSTLLTLTSLPPGPVPPLK